MKHNDLLKKILASEQQAISRAITWIENFKPEVQQLLINLYKHCGGAFVVGVTGAPGAGKSTLINALAEEYLNNNYKTAILAVDPSSPISGGAVLGDRIRMLTASKNSDLFIRSFGSHGASGGLSSAIYDTIDILDAAGYQRIIVETVGVGQSEVAISDYADCIILLLMPGSGDDIQASKAGILEMADLYVLNKADYQNANQTETILKNMLTLDLRSQKKELFFKTVATQKYGIPELFKGIEGHFLQRKLRRREECLDLRIKNEVIQELTVVLLDQLPVKYKQQIDQVKEKRLHPRTLVQSIIKDYLKV